MLLRFQKCLHFRALWIASYVSSKCICFICKIQNTNRCLLLFWVFIHFDLEFINPHQINIEREALAVFCLKFLECIDTVHNASRHFSRVAVVVAYCCENEAMCWNKCVNWLAIFFNVHLTMQKPIVPTKYSNYIVICTCNNQKCDEYTNPIATTINWLNA